MNDPETFDDGPDGYAPLPDLWANAPILHFSNQAPITREDLLEASQGKTKPRPSYGFGRPPS